MKVVALHFNENGFSVSDLVSVAKAELATESGGLLSSSMPSLNKAKSGGSSSLSSPFIGGGAKHPSVVMAPTSREVASLQGGEDPNSGTFGGASVSHRLPRFFFNLVREGDSLTFAVFDESELHAWVQAIHRATGQSHKPVPTTHVISKTHFRRGGRSSSFLFTFTCLFPSSSPSVCHLSHSYRLCSVRYCILTTEILKSPLIHWRVFRRLKWKSNSGSRIVTVRPDELTGIQKPSICSLCQNYYFLKCEQTMLYRYNYQLHCSFF